MAGPFLDGAELIYRTTISAGQALWKGMTLVTSSGAEALRAPSLDWQTTTHFALTVDGTVAGNDLGSLIDAADGGASGTLAAAIAAGLQGILVTVESFPIRVRFDDGDPSSVGLLFAKDNGQPYVWDCDDFTKIKLVGVGGTATVNIALAA